MIDPEVEKTIDAMRREWGYDAVHVEPQCDRSAIVTVRSGQRVLVARLRRSEKGIQLRGQLMDLAPGRVRT